MSRPAHGGRPTRKYWTAGDWRAARKAGAVPPLPKAEVDQPIRPLVPQGRPEVAMSLYGNPSS